MLIIPLACIRFTLVEGDDLLTYTPSSIPSATGSLPPTAPSTPTLVPRVTYTEVTLPTTTPTAEYPPLPSPSPIPSLVTNIHQVKVVALSFLEFNQFMITLQTPEPIVGEYSAKVGDTLFECLSIPPHPNLLYCIGPRPPYDTIVNFKLFSQGDVQPIYETDIRVPMEPLPTPTPKSKQGKRS